MENDDLKTDLTTAYMAGLDRGRKYWKNKLESDRDRWKAEALAAREYIKELEYYLPYIPNGSTMDACSLYEESKVEEAE